MSRGVVPPSKVGLVVIAATVAPIIIKKFRPVAIAAGRGIVKVGKFVENMANADDRSAKDVASPEEKPQSAAEAPKTGTAEPGTSPNATVKNETEKATPESKSASPTGQEEVERQQIKNAMGDGATTKPAPRASQKKKKSLEPEQKLNPRRTKNSKPS